MPDGSEQRTGATPPPELDGNRKPAMSVQVTSPTACDDSPVGALMYQNQSASFIQKKGRPMSPMERRKSMSMSKPPVPESPDKRPNTPGEKAKLITTFRSLSPTKSSDSKHATSAPSAGEDSLSDPKIKLGDNKTFGGDAMYVTSYKKTFEKQVYSDDWMYESHENERFKRELPKSKTPVQLLQLVAQKMTQRHGGSRVLRKAFTAVDLDGNGTLDFQEVCAALVSFNIECSEEECLGLFSAMGADRHGVITYNDFRSAIEDGLSMW